MFVRFLYHFLLLFFLLIRFILSLSFFSLFFWILVFVIISEKCFSLRQNTSENSFSNDEKPNQITFSLMMDCTWIFRALHTNTTHGISDQSLLPNYRLNSCYEHLTFIGSEKKPSLHATEKYSKENFQVMRLTEFGVCGCACVKAFGKLAFFHFI